MTDQERYRRRAEEAEAEAAAVALPQNRLRYLEIARHWRELASERAVVADRLVA